MRTCYDDIQVLCALGFRVLAYEQYRLRPGRRHTSRGLPQTRSITRHAPQFFADAARPRLPLCLLGLPAGVRYAVASGFKRRSAGVRRGIAVRLHRSMDMLMEKNKRYMGPFWRWRTNRSTCTNGVCLARRFSRRAAGAAPTPPGRWCYTATTAIIVSTTSCSATANSTRATPMYKWCCCTARGIDVCGRIARSRTASAAGAARSGPGSTRAASQSREGPPCSFVRRALYWERDDAIWQTILSFLDRPSPLRSQIASA